LQDQIQQLRAKVLRLEEALKQNHKTKAAPAKKPTGAMGMGKMSKMSMDSGDQPASKAGAKPSAMKGMRGSGMKGMGMKGGAMKTGGMGGRKGMSSMGMPGKGMMDGLKMMGQMQGMGRMKMASALPGFPGASHIYHIGATGFFLDHPDHIALTAEQTEKLNQIKEQALLEQATFERKIAEAEQKLWTLTGSDRPDIAKIESQVREIERLRGEKRLAFIRAVGRAAKVLTDEQRKTLVGQHSMSQPAPKAKPGSADKQPTSDGGAAPE
ncbi:MAG: hypothetical protein GXP27_16910, partial [Planctomycetes bacterium]|nr:hypothetical protein [Planctomycetota bacterium]